MSFRGSQELTWDPSRQCISFILLLLTITSLLRLLPLKSFSLTGSTCVVLYSVFPSIFSFIPNLSVHSIKSYYLRNSNNWTTLAPRYYLSMFMSTLAKTIAFQKIMAPQLCYKFFFNTPSKNTAFGGR